jgi:hypothetical protein
MNVGELVSTWPLAVVFQTARDGTIDTAGPAAFVFNTPDGFAYLEDGYLDDTVGVTGNPFHRVRCTLEPAVGESIDFSGPDWTGRIERYTGDAEQTYWVNQRFARFPEVLKETTGRTMAEERAKLLSEMAEDLA